jgi:serine/threonine protein kinase
VEVSILSRLHHPGIIKLLGVCVDGDQRIAVFELLSRGSLSSALGNGSGSGSARSAGVGQPSKEPCQILSWQQRVQIALGLAQGLSYMHQVNAEHLYAWVQSWHMFNLIWQFLRTVSRTEDCNCFTVVCGILCTKCLLDSHAWIHFMHRWCPSPCIRILHLQLVCRRSLPLLAGTACSSNIPRLNVFRAWHRRGWSTGT